MTKKISTLQELQTPNVQSWINKMSNWQNTQWMRAGCPVSISSLRKYAKLKK